VERWFAPHARAHSRAVSISLSDQDKVRALLALQRRREAQPTGSLTSGTPPCATASNLRT
jgi:hypothetical protein